ncbi:MAG: hypothetical protein AB7P21_28255 [Lautropia sp.]
MLMLAMAVGLEYVKHGRIDASHARPDAGAGGGSGATVGAPSGANLTLKQPYTLEPTPNYATPTPVLQGVLTDGKLGRNAHWVSGTSHGWTMASPATVELSLSALSRLTEIRVHASRSPKVGIEWPAVVHAFLSVDGKSYRSWLEPGVLVKTEMDGPNIERGFYRFDLKGRNATKIVVAVFGAPFIFLDEIEAFGTTATEGTPDTAGLGPPFERDKLKGAVRDARIGGMMRTIVARLDSEGRLPKVLAAGDPAPWFFRKEPAPQPRPADSAASSPVGGCSATRIWPWQSFRLDTPQLQPMPAGFEAADVTIAGQPAWFAWQVVNRSASARQLSISGALAKEVEAHLLGYVPTIKSNIVGDALIPYREPLTVQPDESMTLLVKATPAEVGSRPVDVQLDCGGQLLLISAMMKAVQDTRAAPPSHFTAWGYPRGPMRDALTCKPGFEREYGIDTAAIGSDALQDLSDPAQARLLIEQLRISRGAARVLLFMNIRSHEVFRKGADRGGSTCLNS